MFKFQGAYNNGRPTINGKRVSMATWYGFSWGLVALMLCTVIASVVLFYLGFQQIGQHLGVSGTLLMIAFMVVFARFNSNNRSYGLLPDNVVVRVVCKTITMIALVFGLFSILF